MTHPVLAFCFVEGYSESLNDQGKICFLIMVLRGIHFHKSWTWDVAMPTWHRRTSTPSTSWVAQVVTHFCHVSNLKKCLTSDIQQVAGNLKIWILNCAPRKEKWLLKLNANKRLIVDWALFTLTIVRLSCPNPTASTGSKQGVHWVQSSADHSTFEDGC